MYHLLINNNLLIVIDYQWIDVNYDQLSELSII